MEKRDLSVLSLKDLRQMLEAITFNQNRDGDVLRNNEGVKKKFEAEAERKNFAELRNANDEEMPVEATKKSETNMEDEYEEADDQEDLAGEHSLKLQPFSREGDFEADPGNYPKEKVKPNLQAVKLAPSHPKTGVVQINVLRAEASVNSDINCDAEKTWAKCWRYDKRQRDRWKTKLKPSHVVTQRGVMEAGVCFDGRGWSTRSNEEEKGFQFNITQQSTIGLRIFSAQPYYSQIRHAEISKGALPAIVNAENTKRSEAKATEKNIWVLILRLTLGNSKNPPLLDADTTTRKEEDFGHDEAIETAKTKKKGTVVVSFQLALTFSHLVDINAAKGGTSSFNS